MEVHEKDALILEFSGVFYYFCSEGCLDAFLKEHPEKTKRSHYELIIIGGGPAGLTAAVYASMLKIDTFVISKELGGQAFDSSKIENYMGYDFITGPELVKKFRDQLIHFHYVDHNLTEVERVEPVDGNFIVTTSELDTYKTNALIIATGMTRRRLNLEGEEKFQRKGVFYGNIQDYSFVQGEDVAVIGGGNSAMQNAEKLHKIAKTIHLVSEFDLTADNAIVGRINTFKNLRTYENTMAIRFEGERTLPGITVRKKASDEKAVIPVCGVFISIGMEPNSAIAAKLFDLTKICVKYNFH
jgi:alkyl hydroperoxide reductase subunit F